LLSEFRHTELAPLIEQIGSGLTVTVSKQELPHPFKATVSVSVNEPAAVARTWTFEPALDPTIVPLPLIVQLCVAPTVAAEL
jgi:hypothetical protein